MIRAYSSRVCAVLPSICCAVLTMVIAAAALAIAGVPAAVAVPAMVFIAVAVALFVTLTTRVQVMVKADEISYRIGWARWRRLATHHVDSAACVDVGPAAIVGLGIPPSPVTARHIVRGGRALHLRMRSGERIWLSIREPIPSDLLPHQRWTNR